MKKISKRGIFLFMTVIVLIQYISPLVAIANTTENTDLIALNSAKVVGQDDQTVTVDLKVTANNSTAAAQKGNITLDNPAAVVKEVVNKTTTSKNLYTLSKNVIAATIAATINQEANDIQVKLDKASLKDISTLQVLSGNSKTNLDLSGVKQVPAKEEKSSEAPKPTTEPSKQSDSSQKSDNKKLDESKILEKSNLTKSTTKLSASAIDSTVISKATVTDVVQYSTGTHIGRILLNGSKDTIPTPLTNAYVEITIPSDYVESFEVPAASIIKSTVKTVNSDGTTTIRVNLSQIDSTTTASFPFTVKFQDRKTPDGYSINPSIKMFSGEESNPVGVDASGDLQMKNKVLQPSVKKYLYNNSNDAYSADNMDVYGGLSTDTTGHIDNNVQDITFMYAMNTWQAGGGQNSSTGQAQSREYDSVTLTDTLPTYTDKNGNLRTATFDPAKNPGWVLSSDGKTVSKKVEGTGLDANNDELRQLVIKNLFYLLMVRHLELRSIR